VKLPLIGLSELKQQLESWLVAVIHRERPMIQDDGVNVGQFNIIDIAGTATKSGNKVIISATTAAPHDIDGSSHNALGTATENNFASFNASKKIKDSGSKAADFMTPATHTAIGDGAPHHVRAHTIASASDHTGTADRVIYVDHAGAITELALGASGTYLKSNGATSAPTFDTPAGGGAMATDPLWDAAGDLAVGTGADTGAKLALTVPAGANLLNVLGVVNGETTPTWKALFDATHPENLGTAAEGSGTVAALRNHVHAMPKLDDVAAPDNNTDLNASTTAHGLAPLVVDPASAVQRHVLCVDNGEAVYKNADLFDATNPEPTGTAAPGTSLLAAHRDHVHAPAAYVATTDANWDGADEPDTTATALDQLAERITNAHVYIPASAMWPSTDNGCAWPARRESTNSRTNIFYAAFDPAADEYAEFSVVLPVWDQGTIDVTYHWTTVAAGGTTVVWGISATSLANDETLDTAYGAATNADADTVLAAHDFHVIADTGITVAGAGAGELIMCRISRATASDNCASDADLLGVIINYRKRDA
jgi:hypothetical protein